MKNQPVSHNIQQAVHQSYKVIYYLHMSLLYFCASGITDLFSQKSDSLNSIRYIPQ